MRFLLNHATKEQRGAVRDAQSAIARCERDLPSAETEAARGRLLSYSLLSKHRVHQILRSLKESWQGRYIAHIGSATWRQFRKEIIHARGNRCEECGLDGGQQPLHVHHLTYARLGNELASDVKLLCITCHSAKH